jgi:Sortase domain
LIKTLATLLLGALLVGGCTAPDDSNPGEPSGATASSAPASVPAVDPTAIGIPKLGAWSTLIPLGLTDEDCPDEPPCLDTPSVEQPLQAGWYAGADPAFPGDEYRPGEPGPALIVGHVDGIVNGRKGQPGIFHKLHELTEGDEIVVERNDPQTPQAALTYVVTSVQRYPKDAFPSEAVYGETDDPQLRLITCGGAFNRDSGHYDDNVVVYGRLAHTELSR